ncbi:MAG: shikimate kinase [Ruminococcaceae bacterium]|nr:shikimate kinase [Oscillospiraceae bacterium]
MKHIYLIGEHLSHSYSPKIHSCLAGYSYSLKELAREAVSDFFAKREFDGLNVTIPYKKEVMRYLDAISPEAEAIGAVNTVLRQGSTLIGYNTDYFGFMAMVRKSGVTVQGKTVVVIGSGGASKAVCAALSDMGAGAVKVLSHKDNNEEAIHAYTDCHVLVNTSPVGMYPNSDAAPVDLSLFTCCEAVLDLIYNPAQTRLLEEAERLGMVSCNGLYMLVAQAKKAAEIFSGQAICDSRIDEVCKMMELETKNIVLIGMPGCGKTTVGRKLAELLSREFYDSDSEIEAAFGMHPSAFITEKGEQAFRAAESEVLCRLGKQSGCIIATGGGAVTRQENYSFLRQNSTVVFLKRELDALATDNRPLSKDKAAIEALFKTRLPLYRQFCHVEVEAAESPALTAKEIIKKVKEL